MNSGKLRDLIRAVRACKTAADERAVVAQECALIRTAFKEEQIEFRNRNVAKLLFIHMLGYPSHFGQIECIKLITSPSFQDKRIGYLGLMLLLTEKEEVLMLVTNSLKVDLNNPNPFIVGLALAAVGNLATPDIARDLTMDVDRHLQSTNPYIRKKAALCAIRILRKIPEHIEDFTERIVSVIKDRHHGVLLAGVQLITSVIELDPNNNAPPFAGAMSILVRILRNLVSVGYMPEHDVAGVTDPFLQVKVLRLLRLLCAHTEGASAAEQMNDMLAKVATTTETAKNAGNAILYECVQTIMSNAESEQSLRVLAVNILGRFLLNRDNNIRYVALNTLNRVIAMDVAAVQRHRGTIVECLKDPDVSIRQRALELIYQLVNEQNVVLLVRELLNYLVVALPEHKGALCDKVMLTVERYSPDKRWRIDALMTLLHIAGGYADESIPAAAIIYIGQCVEYQPHTVHKLYRMLEEESNTAQAGLIHVGVWCIGEYGDALASAVPAMPGNAAGASDAPAYSAVAPEQVLGLLEKLLVHHSATTQTRSYALTALAKLSSRLGTSARISEGVARLLLPYQSSISLELQQRACEYSSLLMLPSEAARAKALERMPVLDEDAFRERRARFVDDRPNAGPSPPRSPPRSPPMIGGEQGNDFAAGAAFAAVDGGAAGGAKSTAVDGGKGQASRSLLDLDDIFGSSAAAILPATTNGTGTGAPASQPLDPFGGNGSGGDMLSSIFAAPAAASAAPAAAAASDEFAARGNGGLAAAAAVAATPATASVTAFEKNGLVVVMEMSKPDPSDPSRSSALCRFRNSSGAEMTALNFQVALPKYLSLVMHPASGAIVPADSAPGPTQMVEIVNSMQGSKGIMMKLRIGYIQNGRQVTETAQVTAFPQGF